MLSNRPMLAVDRSLDLICIKGNAFSRDENLNLPTWMPDWVNLSSGRCKRAIYQV